VTEPTSEVAEETEETVPEAAAEAVPEAAPVEVQAVPTVVSETDLLRAENVNLRLIVAANRETLAQQALNEAVKERLARANDMQAFRSFLEGKYSINLTTHQINERTGAIVPRQ
jgi:hypothetical protein